MPSDSALYDIGRPKKGETIFVSAAAGAVGQMVVQLAKHEGLTTIGSVGDDKKLEFLNNEIKCDKAFNHKKEKPSDALTRLAPDGIDIYFDVRILCRPAVDTVPECSGRMLEGRHWMLP